MRAIITRSAARLVREEQAAPTGPGAPIWAILVPAVVNAIILGLARACCVAL